MSLAAGIQAAELLMKTPPLRQGPPLLAGALPTKSPGSEDPGYSIPLRLGGSAGGLRWMRWGCAQRARALRRALGETSAEAARLAEAGAEAGNLLRDRRGGARA